MTDVEEWPFLFLDGNGGYGEVRRVSLRGFPPPPIVWIPREPDATPYSFRPEPAELVPPSPDHKFNRINEPLFGGGLCLYGYVEERR